MLLSLIVPMYNSSKYINQLFDSVLEGIEQDMELILIDDGSVDDTYEKSKIFAADKKNVHIVKNNNHGVSYSRNYGLKSAKGTYVMFLDSDDLLEKGWYGIVEKAVQSSNYSDIIIFSKFINDMNPKLEDVIQSIIGCTNEKVCNYLTSVCSKLYKKDFLRQHNIFFDEHIINGEDALFNINAFISSSCYYFVEDTFYLYRTNLSSATHRYDEKFLYSNEKFLISLYDSLFDDKRFSEKIINKWVDYSFVNSIYIHIGRILKLDSYKERVRALDLIYKKRYYKEKLRNAKIIKEMPVVRKIIYILVKYRLIYAIIIFLLKKSARMSGEIFVSI